ncbi:MAG TPA: hypothetical protein VH559_17455 [Gemmatimonadaceae bacterium]
MGTFERRMEIGVTVLLSVSAIGTSWAGYQATLWSGNQIEFASDAQSIRARATRATTKAGLQRTVDVSLFTSWLESYARHDTVYTQFIRHRFRPEFSLAFEAWLATKPAQNPNAPLTPFAMQQYHLLADDSALLLDRLADSTATLGVAANQNSDAYVLGAVLFATAMVFGGAARAESTSGRMQLILIALSTMMCVMGLVRLATSPTTL